MKRLAEPIAVFAFFSIYMLLGAFALSSGFAPGPRLAVIYTGNAKITTHMGQQHTFLRSGENEKYLAEKHHTLLILSDSTVDKDGKAPTELAEAKRVSSVKKKPVLMIVTKDSSHVLYCEELPDKYTDEYVIGKLKEYGG